MRFTKMAVLMSAALALPATAALAQGQQGSQPQNQQQQQPGQAQPGQAQPGQAQPGEQQPGETKPGETKPGETKPSEGKKAKLSQQDLQIMGQVHQINRMEIEQARLAEKRAHDPQVKSLAKTLVTDHEQLDHKMKTMAKQHHSTIPSKAKNQTAAQKQEMQNQKATLANLKKLKGAAFDRAFLTAVVSQHQQAISYVQKAQGETQNADLKTALGNALPVLMKHRDMAQKLQQPTPSS